MYLPETFSADQFNGLGIFLDTYANEKHTYSFPRIVGILGDGKMKYDFGRDGEGQEIGSCSVCVSWIILQGVHSLSS